jgi:predicted RNA-binding protein YlqC (UPF0109 family)
VVESTVARAILRELAQCWPEHADLEKVVIHENEIRIAVAVWTSTPGRVIGRRGSTASEIKERLCAVLPGKVVEFTVCTEEPSEGPIDPHSETDSVGAMPQGVGAMPQGVGAMPHGVVPDLVGMTVRDAHTEARSSGFHLTTGDPDGAPITFYMAHGHWVVSGQSPFPGVFAPLHSQIVVDVEERGGGGESGDREPRVPGPPGGVVELERSIDIEEALVAAIEDALQPLHEISGQPEDI